MKRVLALAIAVAVIAGTGVASAAAAPKGNGNGNAYAYGVIKNVDNRGQAKKDDAPPPPPADGGGTVFGNYETLTVYGGPLNMNPAGLQVAVFPGTKTGTLGYCNRFLGHTSYYWLTAPVYSVYYPVFTAQPTYTSVSCSWATPEARITYAYPGYTTVTVDGVAYPYGSPQATAALATPGVQWQCTYRERYDLNFPATGTGQYSFNGWVISDYTPVQ